MKSAKSPNILSASAATLLQRPLVGLRNLRKASRWAGAAVLAAMLGTGVHTATAATQTWDGSINNLWSENGNWSTAAPMSFDSVVFAGTTRLNNRNDLALVLNSITFASNAGPFVLTGNSLGLDAGGLTNNSSETQTIAFRDSFGGILLTAFNGDRQVWNALAGDIVVNSDVSFFAPLELVITGDHNTTITGVVSDNTFPVGGVLIKEGKGTLRLTNLNTYTGDTIVNGGTLIVDGSIGSVETFVNRGGTLAGVGTIDGTIYNFGGNVAPGNSPGTMHVGQNYVQNSDGTLTIAVKSRGEHSKLAVKGNADLDGTLRLVTVGKGPRLKAGSRITVLTAEQGVDGKFSKVAGLKEGSIITGKAIYHDTSVEVEVTGAFGAYADEAGLTPNQRATAHGLDKIVFRGGNAPVIRYLSTRDVATLPSDLDRIAPEELSSIFNIGISLNTVQSQNLQRRTADIRSGSRGFSAAGFHTAGSGPNYSGTFGVAGPTGDGKESKKTFVPTEDNRWGVFLTGVGEWVDVDGDGNARGFDITTGGFTLGLDYKVTENFAVGVAAGYAGTGADLNNDGRIYVNNGKLGVYATYFQGGFYADAAINGGLSSYDTKRGSINGAARGRTEGGEVNILVGGGYDWQVGSMTIGPTFNFQFTHMGIEEFTEHGSDAPLKIPTQGEESYRTALGLKAAWDWRCGGVLIKPEVRLAWQHEYGETAYNVDAGFAGFSNSDFTVSGPEIGRDSLLVGAGVAVLWNERTSTYLYYDGELARENYEAHNVSGGIRLSF